MSNVINIDDSNSRPALLVCQLDHATRPYTHLTQQASCVERAILFVFDLEVLSAEEAGLKPNLNEAHQTVPISTPNLPVFWRTSESPALFTQDSHGGHNLFTVRQSPGNTPRGIIPMNELARERDHFLGGNHAH